MISIERQEQQAKKERLASETPAELEVLKGFISEFAVRSVDGNQFVGANALTGDPIYAPVFKDVAATVSMRDPPKSAGLRFGRIPGATYLSTCGIESITWEVTPDIVNDNFVWRINGDGGNSPAAVGRCDCGTTRGFHVDYEESYRQVS